MEANPARAADIAPQCLKRLSTFAGSPSAVHGTALDLAAALTGTACGMLGIIFRNILYHQSAMLMFPSICNVAWLNI